MHCAISQYGRVERARARGSDSDRIHSVRVHCDPPAALHWTHHTGTAHCTLHTPLNNTGTARAFLCTDFTGFCIYASRVHAYLRKSGGLT